MDREDVIQALQKMYEPEIDDDSAYTFEQRYIDKRKYVSLVAKDTDEFIRTDPDYDAFIHLLKCQKSKDCNYALSVLNSNLHKIFVDYDDIEKATFLDAMRDYHKRLLGATTQNKALVEDTIKEWATSLFLQ